MIHKTMSLKEAAEILGYSLKGLQNRHAAILEAMNIRYIKAKNGRVRVIARDVERYQDLNIVNYGGRK